MGRCCCVIGCHNSWYTLKNLKKDICPIHKVLFSSSSCDCPKPFTLYSFPFKRNYVVRSEWIKRVNRGKGWQPDRYARVCSRHFIDGKPTSINPYPILEKGYDVPENWKKSNRKAPNKRIMSVPSKISKCPCSSTSDPVPDVGCEIDIDSESIVESLNFKSSSCTISTNVTIDSSSDEELQHNTSYNNSFVEHSYSSIHPTTSTSVSPSLLARNCVHWPKINAEIAELIGKCMICNTYKNNQPSEPMVLRDLPSRPFECVGSDLFDWNNHKYLLLCDYYSKFPFVRKLSNERSGGVINHMKQIFSEHGIPEVLYSDNGPCYACREFEIFTKKYGMKHTTSSPKFAQSNGFSERFVGIVKSILTKCKASQEDFDLALLFIQSTPVAHNLPSPAELLYNRPIKSILPLCFEKYTQHDEYKDILKQRQETQKYYFDKNTQYLPELRPGESIMLQTENGMWTPASVVRKRNEPRSYDVQTNEGACYRRNRKFLRKVPNVFTKFRTSCNDEVDSSLKNMSSTKITSDTSSTNVTNPNLEPSENKKKVTFSDSDAVSILMPNPLNNKVNLDDSLSSSVNPNLRKSGRDVKKPQRFIDEM